MTERTTLGCDIETSQPDRELECKLKSLERRFESWVEETRSQAGDLSRNALLNRVEKDQPKLAREIKILRIIRDISAKQNATGSVNRPRDVSRHASGNALIEPRGNWRPGRRFSR